MFTDWTIQRLLAWTTDYFKTHRIDSPRATAEILLAHALGMARIDLYTQHDKPLNALELADFRRLIKRRLKREPVAYIVGGKGFWNLELSVTGDVLIPRPETECLVEAALSILSADGQSAGTVGPRRVLEPGTGSGAVILALASERPENIYWASDISRRAVALAKKNAVGSNLAARVHFFSGNWFQPLAASARPFDVIVSNPPYIPQPDLGRLQPEIRDYEPKIALDGDRDGLGSIRYLIRSAHGYLHASGFFAAGNRS